MSTLFAVLLTSLFGSLHCAGMCGPLVAFAMGGTERVSHARRVLLQFAYHGGRLATYALVGAICGLLGAALDLGGAAVGLQRIACLLAGGMMVVVGGLAVLRYGGVRLPHWPTPQWLQRLLQAGQRLAIALRPGPRALTIGLLTALLPCGWLYAFAIIAAGTGRPLMGAAVMIAFWLGTVPILASLGVAVQALTGTIGRRLPLATAVLLVLLGLSTIAERWALSGETWRQSSPVQTPLDPEQQLQDLEDSRPACCRHQGE